MDFRWVISGLLPLFALAHFSHHLMTALLVPLLPMIRGEFHLDYTQAGLLLSAFNLTSGISQLPGGWLADRVGSRLMTTIGLSGMALAGIAVGLSHSLTMATIFLALMGILAGAYHPAATPMVSRSVKPQHRGRALGVHAIGGSISAVASPIVATGIAGVLSWRGSFIGLALPTLFLGIFLYFRLGKHFQVPSGKRRTLVPDERPSSGDWRRLAVFLFLINYYAATIVSIASFIPLFLVDHLHFSKQTAAAFYALIYAVGFLSPLWGHVSDRFGQIPVILTLCFLAGPVIYLLTLVSSLAWLIPMMIMIGMLIYIRIPSSESFIIGNTTDRNRSMIMGIYYFGNLEGAGVLTPVLGNLIDRFGFHNSFAIIGIALLIPTLICAPLLRGNRR